MSVILDQLPDYVPNILKQVDFDKDNLVVLEQYEGDKGCDYCYYEGYCAGHECSFTDEEDEEHDNFRYITINNNHEILEEDIYAD